MISALNLIMPEKLRQPLIHWQLAGKRSLQLSVCSLQFAVCSKNKKVTDCGKKE
jgi:hypothetical protein